LIPSPRSPLSPARKQAWLHVDGAFGLWAATDPSRRHLVEGVALADSWATDAHKWLNVPYDSGIVIVREPSDLSAAITKSAAYLIRSSGEARDNHDFTPESSRRARGFALWAALRSLGRSGVGEMVSRCCDLARRMADRLREGGVPVLNDVVLNQVLVRFTPSGGGDADAFTKAVVGRIQRVGITWASGTRRHDRDALRISVSSWATTEGRHRPLRRSHPGRGARRGRSRVTARNNGDHRGLSGRLQPCRPGGRRRNTGSR
jgi:glutamate/tyrosine decarboxylase-like PLP-dependent enzyme